MKSGAVRRIIPYFTGIALILFVVLAVALVVVLNTFRKNTFRIMEKDGTALLETVVQSSRNALASGEIVDELVADRLLANAQLVDELETPSGRALAQIAHLHGALGIDVVDARGRIVSSSLGKRTLDVPADSLKEVLAGTRSRSAFVFEDGDAEQFVLVYGREGGAGAVLVYADPKEMTTLKRDVGIGYLLQRIGGEPRIEYLVLQDEEGIIAATRNIRQMTRLSDDPFLQTVLKTEGQRTRITRFAEERILEIVQPFYFRGELIGMFRLGMDMSEYHAVLRGGQRQIILVLSVVLLFALASAFLILSQQGFRQVQRSYSEMRRSVREILDSLPVGVLWVDADLRIRSVNESARRILGLTPSSEGASYPTLFPDDLPLLERVVETREPASAHRIPSGARGSERTISISASPIITRLGTLEGAVAVLEDVTERIELEERVRRSRELEALGNLAAGVAHEIRNPLNAISLSVQQLERYLKEVPEEFRKLLRTVRDEIQRLEESIRRFLSLTSPLSLNPKKGDLNARVTETLELLSGEATQRNVTLSRRLGDLEPVIFDPDKIHEALLNLIRNAFESMPDGGEIEIGTVREEERTDLWVRDSGAGIEADDLPKIFTPYFTTKRDGSGIGLSYVQRIMAAHGGAVTVESEPGEGTMVRLEFRDG
jgi:PAS domain S-box-containing protein